ncbi:efflux RND transporter periplasmic adaptor subunit [bacterium]|nr:efflux RND transporter periplasmic adaptor subunit [bacterium]RQV98044.1 MAG: hypothetical protein EH221_02795 [bacterium]
MTNSIHPDIDYLLSKKMFIRIFIYLIFVLPFLVLSNCESGSSSTDMNQSRIDINDIQFVVGLGRIEPELKMLELTSEIQGLVERVHIQPGEEVVQGEAIIEMRRDVEKARVKQAEAKVESQIAIVQGSEASLAAATIKMENAKKNSERMESLFQQGVVTQSSFDDVRTSFESLLEETNRLKAELTSQQFLLKQYQADLELVQAQLRQKIIEAPADGQLLSLDITIGSMITPGQPFGTFALKSPITAYCEIDELFAHRIKYDQRSVIRSEGMTDTLAVGTVVFVGPYLREKSIFSDDVSQLEDRRIREVRIQLEPNPSLLYGQRVECVVFVDE